MEEDFYLKDETFKMIGICMEVHTILGKGFSETVYGDALEYEFKRQDVPFEREKRYMIDYKDVVLSHFYVADFVVFGEIILEIKAIKELTKSEIR